MQNQTPFILLLLLIVVPGSLLAQAPFITCGDSLVTYFDNSTVTNTSALGYEFDFDGDNTMDFTMESNFWLGTSEHFSYSRLFPANANRSIHYKLDSSINYGTPPPNQLFNVPVKLDFGDSITLQGMDWISGAVFLHSYQIGGYSIPHHYLYPWDSTSGYIGLRITEPNYTCIGWLHCEEGGNIYGLASSCNTYTDIPLPFSEDVIRIGPNPSNGKFSLRFAPPEMSEYSVEITDLSGRLVDSRSRLATHQSHVEFFDLQTYPKGVYIIQVRQGKQVWHSRVVFE